MNLKLFFSFFFSPPVESRKWIEKKLICSCTLPRSKHDAAAMATNKNSIQQFSSLQRNVSGVYNLFLYCVLFTLDFLSVFWRANCCQWKTLAECFLSHGSTECRKRDRERNIYIYMYVPNKCNVEIEIDRYVQKNKFSTTTANYNAIRLWTLRGASALCILSSHTFSVLLVSLSSHSVMVKEGACNNQQEQPRKHI